MALSSNWLGRHPLKVMTPVRIRIALQIIALWCNGNIGDSDSFVQGSNPCKATKKYTRLAQLVRVPGLYPGGRGFKSLNEYFAL